MVFSFLKPSGFCSPPLKTHTSVLENIKSNAKISLPRRYNMSVWTRPEPCRCRRGVYVRRMYFGRNNCMIICARAKQKKNSFLFKKKKMRAVSRLTHVFHSLISVSISSQFICIITRREDREIGEKMKNRVPSSPSEYLSVKIVKKKNSAVQFYFHSYTNISLHANEPHTHSVCCPIGSLTTSYYYYFWRVRTTPIAVQKTNNAFLDTATTKDYYCI